MDNNEQPFRRDQVKTSKIFISIDHLEQGVYQLQITQNNKTIKTIKFHKK